MGRDPGRLFLLFAVLAWLAAGPAWAANCPNCGKKMGAGQWYQQGSAVGRGGTGWCSRACGEDAIRKNTLKAQEVEREARRQEAAALAKKQQEEEDRKRQGQTIVFIVIGVVLALVGVVAVASRGSGRRERPAWAQKPEFRPAEPPPAADTSPSKPVAEDPFEAFARERKAKGG